MIRIKPGPRLQPLVIVLTVELKTLNIGFDNILKHCLIASINNIETASVIIINTIDNLVILYFKFLYFTILILFILIRKDGWIVLLTLELPGLPAIALHLGNHIGFEFPGQFKQSRNVLPVYVSIEVNKLLILLQVFFVLQKQRFHMIIFQNKTKLHWKKIISYKSHKQHQIIYHILNRAVFNRRQHFPKLSLKILPQNVYQHYLKLRSCSLAKSGSCSPVHAGKLGCIFLDNADVVQVERKSQQYNICVWRVNTVCGILIEKLSLLAVSKKIHYFVLPLSWHATVRIKHMQTFPFC